MPANTPKGFPYPLPTEPVAEGAQAIRNLAEADDRRSPLYAELKPQAAYPASGGYADITPVVSVTVPVAGQYEITFSANIGNSAGGAATYVAAKLGAAATLDEDSVGNASGVAGGIEQAAGPFLRTLAAGAVVKMQYKGPGGPILGRVRLRVAFIKP